MGNCRIAIHESYGKVTTISCNTLRKEIDNMKKTYREVNDCDKVIKMLGRDKSYEKYCQELDNFLEKCNCEKEISLKCDHCSEEDHKEYFCLCKGRNIRLSKQLRNQKYEMDQC